uniref:Uncharacterized protein n=1 Tax=Panagrolaimus sp. JU765 TaxID=591449 RepID=A0AC34RN93_9BILA
MSFDNDVIYSKKKIEEEMDHGGASSADEVFQSDAEQDWLASGRRVAGQDGQTASDGASDGTQSSAGASDGTQSSAGASDGTQSNNGASDDDESSTGASDDEESSTGASDDEESGSGASADEKSGSGASADEKSGNDTSNGKGACAANSEVNGTQTESKTGTSSSFSFSMRADAPEFHPRNTPGPSMPPNAMPGPSMHPNAMPRPMMPPNVFNRSFAHPLWCYPNQYYAVGHSTQAQYGPVVFDNYRPRYYQNQWVPQYDESEYDQSGYDQNTVMPPPVPMEPKKETKKGKKGKRPSKGKKKKPASETKKEEAKPASETKEEEAKPASETKKEEPKPASETKKEEPKSASETKKEEPKSASNEKTEKGSAGASKAATPTTNVSQPAPANPSAVANPASWSSYADPVVPSSYADPVVPSSYADPIPSSSRAVANPASTCPIAPNLHVPVDRKRFTSLKKDPLLVDDIQWQYKGMGNMDPVRKMSFGSTAFTAWFASGVTRSMPEAELDAFLRNNVAAKSFVLQQCYDDTYSQRNRFVERHGALQIFLKDVKSAEFWGQFNLRHVANWLSSMPNLWQLALIKFWFDVMGNLSLILPHLPPTVTNLQYESRGTFNDDCLDNLEMFEDKSRIMDNKYYRLFFSVNYFPRREYLESVMPEPFMDSAEKPCAEKEKVIEMLGKAMHSASKVDGVSKILFLRDKFEVRYLKIVGRVNVSALEDICFSKHFQSLTLKVFTALNVKESQMVCTMFSQFTEVLMFEWSSWEPINATLILSRLPDFTRHFKSKLKMVRLLADTLSTDDEDVLSLLHELREFVNDVHLLVNTVPVVFAERLRETAYNYYGYKKYDAYYYKLFAWREASSCVTIGYRDVE